jgi:hypothetical protein
MAHDYPAPHPLELTSQQFEVPRSESFDPACLHQPTASTLASPLSYVDVYIDDFIALAHRLCPIHTLHHLLWAITRVFRHDPHPADSPHRKQVISASKLAQGDGAWSTEKIILGWLINTATGTLALPQHKEAHLLDRLHHFLGLRRTSRRKWQQLLGELRHMALAIHGASYLFSILQHVLVDQPTATRLRLNPLVHASLSEWCQLAMSLATHPVPITSLVPRAPAYVGAVDASRHGLGGFWISSRFGHLPHPTAFRFPFPHAIQHQLVSTSNPLGRITNSDLEMAALIAGTATLATIAPTKHALLLCASDNTPAVSWCSKGSTSAVAPSAFFLRQLAQLSRQHQLNLKVISIPGSSNTIADFCSRSFSLLDQDFLRELQQRFPTHPSWQLAHLTKETKSATNSALLREMSPWEFASREPMPPTPPGTFGPPFAKAFTKTLPCPPPMTPSHFSNSSLIDTARAALLPAKLRSAAERWAMPFVPLARCWPDWATLTPASNHRVSLNFASDGN